MRTILLEEHFSTPEFSAGPGRELTFGGVWTTELCDLGAGRIAAMDAAGIDVQVVSLTAPGTEQLAGQEAAAWARTANDTAAAAVAAHPGRLRGFAALPTADPAAAAAELTRAVGELGFVGAMINGHVRGRYLDDDFFAPLLARAEELAVPLYLHPTPPPQPVIDASYTGNFPDQISLMLSTAGFGWHIETANHVLRMVLSGVFDRFPRLQVMIGHLGESLPFMLPRIETVFGDPRRGEVGGLQRPVGDYFRENVHYTFGGFNYLPTFLNLLMQVGVDRILFSADYPFAPMDAARAFLESLPLSKADRNRIAHGNAEALLGI